MSLYTEEERRTIMENVIEVMISVTFGSHLYRWEGKIFRQMKGGAIGLHCTGSLAKICMDLWVKKFKKILMENGVQLFLLTKYVDDIFLISRTLSLDKYWDGEKIASHGEDFIQPSGISKQEHTLNIFLQIANSIIECLKFTGEVSTDAPISVLDTQFWVGKPSCNSEWFHQFGKFPSPGKKEEETGAIPLYMFFKKEMSPKIGILKRSAIPEQCKVATSVAEVKRRLKNCSTLISRELIETILVEYSDEMAAAGYTLKWRESILMAAVTGYERVLWLEREGRTSRNRGRISTLMSRRARKLQGMYNWFQEKVRTEDTPVVRTQNNTTRRKKSHPARRKIIYESVMFLPCTKGGILKRRLTEMEERLNQNTRLKYVEKMGNSLADILVCKDPWASMGCGRVKCLPCQTSPGKCM